MEDAQTGWDPGPSAWEFNHGSNCDQGIASSNKGIATSSFLLLVASSSNALVTSSDLLVTTRTIEFLDGPVLKPVTRTPLRVEDSRRPLAEFLSGLDTAQVFMRKACIYDKW